MNKNFQNFTIFPKEESLVSLVTSKKILSLDSIALGSIGLSTIQNSGMSKTDFIGKIMHNQSSSDIVIDTFLGRIGVFVIPIVSEEIYNDDGLVNALQDAIALAELCGAKCASLTGLIPSATNYGYDIKAKNKNPNFLITTGHGTTTSAMVLNIEHVLDSTRRNIELETLACIGLGSIGLTTLQLMLSVLKHPKKLILCDIFSKLGELEKISHMLSSHFNYKGEILIAESINCKLPELVYNEATLLVGATNVPNIVSHNLLKPGIIIVDDSAPHIFDPLNCIERFKKQKDILVLQGGKLTLPVPIHFTYYYDNSLGIGKTELEEVMVHSNLYEIMGCVLGSILPLASNKTPATLGLVETKIAISYYNFLKEQRIKGSSLQCEDYYYQQNDIVKFTNICRENCK
ncbi:hypothetical protein [Candidatus Tisiphia endosymbiont of Hybos culiciformis]|uniref:hypothetical protein n=1 Tax=Candidatus Tisiphia endosymbiont of Hybos culiciformis TaxID=3139331 RepID=UPI003CCAEDCC